MDGIEANKAVEAYKAKLGVEALRNVYIRILQGESKQKDGERLNDIAGMLEGDLTLITCQNKGVWCYTIIGKNQSETPVFGMFSKGKFGLSVDELTKRFIVLEGIATAKVGLNGKKPRVYTGIKPFQEIEILPGRKAELDITESPLVYICSYS